MKEEILIKLEEKLPEELEFSPVFSQPKLKKVREGKYKPESLIKWAKYCLKRNDREEFNRVYNELLQEYKPLLEWAYACWDYLLTTQGFRYLPRKGLQKYFCHGDYRALTIRDYKKLVNKCFKELVLTYSPNGSLTKYLKARLWNKVVREYDKLKYPQNAKERLLTNYSYLRCIPYKFFNRYHQKRVEEALSKLDADELEIIDLYFFHFYREEVCAGEKKISLEDFLKLKEKILQKLKDIDLLSYALLKQIERY